MTGKTKAKSTAANTMTDGAPARKTVAGRKRATFKLQAEPGCKVFVAGSFNNWDTGTHPLTDKDGTGAYALTILLLPGVYEYKFWVDGVWCVDPACADWVQNSLGTLNSLLRV